MRIYIYLVRIDSYFYKLLSKKEKKIKKHQYSPNKSYLINHYLYKDYFMDKEKNWMLITYY